LDVSGTMNINGTITINNGDFLIGNSLRITDVGGITYIQAGDGTGTTGSAGDLFIGNWQQATGASSRKIMFGSNGNVGIGTQSPSHTLDVSGGIYASQYISTPIITIPENGNIFMTEGQINGVSSINGYSFQTLIESDVWTITPEFKIYYNNGDVGIGTESPYNNLQVATTEKDARVGISVVSDDVNTIIGAYTASPTFSNVGSIQATSNGTLWNPYTLAINPRGGDVYIGNATHNTHILSNSTFTNNFKPTTIIDSVNNIGSMGQVLSATGSGIEWVTNSQPITEELWDNSGNNIFYNTGNVGIGTSTPEANLDVSGTMNINGTITINNGDFLIGNSLRITDVGGITYIQAGDGSGIQGSAGDLFIGNWQQATGASSRKIMFGSNGNVGIGTNSPGEILDVRGNIRIGSSISDNYMAFYGTYDDGPGNFNHTFIGERLYNIASGSSELLIYKGNDSYNDEFIWINREVTGLWRDVVWSPERSLFVAVGSSGSIMTSTDGVNWIYISTSIDRTWASVCWSAERGLFVAVSFNSIFDTSNIMTSTDGVNWTLVTNTPSGFWRDVIWSQEKNLFVAVGNFTGVNGKIITSPDGTDWTLETLPFGSSLISICWSPERELFIVGGSPIPSGSPVFLTSSNGTDWSTTNIPLNYFWNSITWSSELGLFVAVGTKSGGGVNNTIMTSTDGLTWTPQTHGNNSNIAWNSVCWSPERLLFVAVGAIFDSPIGNRCIISSDGINWTNITTNANTWSEVCWSSELELFVAVAGAGINNVMTSTLMKPDRLRIIAGELRFDTIISTITTNSTTTFEDIATTQSTINRMIITSDGNVGIGTQTPSHTLDVSGGIHASSYISTSILNMPNGQGQIIGVSTINGTPYSGNIGNISIQFNGTLSNLTPPAVELGASYTPITTGLYLFQVAISNKVNPADPPITPSSGTNGLFFAIGKLDTGSGGFLVQDSGIWYTYDELAQYNNTPSGEFSTIQKQSFITLNAGVEYNIVSHIDNAASGGIINAVLIRIT
jgi:hypothetical protein